MTDAPGTLSSARALEVTWVAITRIRVRTGHPLLEIVDEVNRRSVDLLVMGTHGRIEAVVYKAILCPVGFSQPSIRALEFGRLLLLHVVEVQTDEMTFGENTHYTVPV